MRRRYPMTSLEVRRGRTWRPCQPCDLRAHDRVRTDLDDDGYRIDLVQCARVTQQLPAEVAR